jgi:hypothetical protein
LAIANVEARQTPLTGIKSRLAGSISLASGARAVVVRVGAPPKLKTPSMSLL